MEVPSRTSRIFGTIGAVLVVAGLLAGLAACVFPFTTPLTVVGPDGAVRQSVAATVIEGTFMGVMFFGLGLGVGFLRLAESDA
jgi:hypothetical protein